MKKALFIGVFFTLAVPFTSFAAFDSNLKYGSSGSSVTELQEFLTDQGVYSGPITGNFYSLTLAAVKAFQTKAEISPISGFFGPISRAKAIDMLDLSASNDDEEKTTGTISTPVSVPVAQVSVIPPSTTQVTIPATETTTVPPHEVKFDFPFANCGVPPTEHNSTWAGVGCNYTNKGDKITLNIEGFSPIIETVNTPAGRNGNYNIGTERGVLAPDSKYNYTLKLERGNEYGFQSGVLITKAD